MNKNPVIYVLTNVINKKQYVGSTGNLARRRSQHLSDLRLGVHPVSDLQSDYNQFGRDSIIFSVLLYECINKPIEKYRNRLYKKSI